MQHESRAGWEEIIVRARGLVAVEGGGGGWSVWAAAEVQLDAADRWAVKQLPTIGWRRRLGSWAGETDHCMQLVLTNRSTESPPLIPHSTNLGLLFKEIRGPQNQNGMSLSPFRKIFVEVQRE